MKKENLWSKTNHLCRRRSSDFASRLFRAPALLFFLSLCVASTSCTPKNIDPTDPDVVAGTVVPGAAVPSVVTTANVVSVASVSTSTATGTYPVGTVVDVAVGFSGAVTVVGTPAITLNTTPPRTADYVSGSGSSTLVFNYTVQAGDSGTPLDYASVLALSAGTSIQDSAGVDANLTLPATGSSSFFAATVAVDATPAPTVATVTTTTNAGTYKTGDAINVTVNFSKAVLVASGTPQITLATTPNHAVNYASGSGSAALVFTYTVQAGDTAAQLDYLATSALALNGATIKDALGNDATLTLPATASSALYTKNIVIDGVLPVVASVTTTTSTGSKKIGDQINVTVNFTKVVTVATATPQITLATTPNRTVNYASGSGSTSLVFTYTVQAGDAAAQLDYLSTSALALNGATIKDALGNNATLTLPATTSSGFYTTNIVIDGVAPTVASVTTTTGTGTKKIGDQVNVTVNFTKAVTVATAAPQITLATTPNRTVNYASGSGSTALVFTYTVQAGDTAARLDYLSTSALALNGATIKDTTGNDATLALPATASSGLYTTNIAVDAVAPTVASVTTTTSAGTYKIGDAINVTVNFTKAVTVATAAPQITLATTPNHAVNYASGSGSTALVFTYTVQTGDTAAQLDYLSTSALALNGATIKDALGNDATLTLPATASSAFYTKNIVVDAVQPTVASVTTTTSTGTKKIGDQINVTVNFTKAVTVAGGTPQITLGTTPNRTVNLASGSTTSALVFTYTVQSGDTAARLDYLNTTALALGGATIKDTSGNDANLTLPNTGVTSGLYTTNIAVDGVAPTVASVTTTTGTGTKKIGDQINVTVNFTKAVTVAGGTPQITLGTTPNRAVDLASGSTTSALVFTYTVISGDSAARLDYLNTTALALGGATIKDANGNDAALTLPNTGATSGLYTTNIAVDGVAPTVASVTTTTGTGTKKIGDQINVTVNFTKAVTVAGGTPQITLGTAPNRAVDLASGSTTSALVFTYTVQSGDTAAKLDYLSAAALAFGGATIKDTAGNDAVLTLPNTGATSGLYTTNIAVDGVAPTVGAVNADKGPGAYKAGTAIKVTVNFTKAVIVTGTPQITLNTTATNEVVDYSPGASTSTDLVFTYTVQAGDTAAKLDYLSTSALALNAGSIQDAAGNDAVLTLPGTGATSGVYNNSIQIDTTAPDAPSGLVLKTPNYSPSSNATPVITVSGVTSGDTVGLYKDDSSCGAGNLVTSGVAAGATIDITTTTLNQIRHTFYAAATDPAGNQSACSTATIAYRYLPSMMLVSSLDGTAANEDNNGGSSVSAITPDGRYVLFNSSATNLVTGASGGQIYLKDLATGSITLVSSTDGTAANRDLSGSSTAVSITPDGQYVLFHSGSINLVAGASGQQVYLKNLQTGAITLVSSTDGTVGNEDLSGSSTAVSITPDGRYVNFYSNSTNLVAGTLGYQAYLNDLQTGLVSLISSTDGTGTNQSNGSGFEQTALTPDGRYVAFGTDTTNFVAGTTGFQVFLKDLQTGTMTLVSSTDGTVANEDDSGACTVIAITPDARYVLFHTAASNLVSGGSGTNQIYLKDLQTGAIRLVSSTDGTVANEDASATSNGVAISPDGRYVLFYSSSGNLVTGASGVQTYLKKLVGGSIGLVSSTDGSVGNEDGSGSSYPAALTPDANYAGFNSPSTNLISGTSGQQAYIRFFDRGPSVSVTYPVANSSLDPAAASVSGYCSDEGQTVTVSVGGVTDTPTCTYGMWSSTLDLTSVTHGAVTVTADHSTANPGLTQLYSRRPAARVSGRVQYAFARGDQYENV